MAKISSVKADPVKAESGVWVDYEAGIRLKIARMNNPAFEAFVRAKQRPKIRGFRANKATDDELNELTREAVARHVLVGWENVEDDDGNLIPYSPEKSLEFLKDPALSDLYQFVVLQASDAAAYRAEATEEAVKN